MSEQNVRYQLLILAAAALIFFTYLGAAALWDEDETLYASCAREMMDRGDWVVPWFNGRMFPDKPPLMFWLMMAGFEIFGQNEFGARFFSAVLGVGTALLSYHLGRLMFNRKSRPVVGFDNRLLDRFYSLRPGGNRRFGLGVPHHYGNVLFCRCAQGSGFRVQGSEERRTQNSERGTENYQT